jgi:hypothetical protein
VIGKVIAIGVVMGAACGGTSPAPVAPVPIAPPVRARVEVAPMTCPSSADAEARLAAVLASHRAENSDLIVRVAAIAGDGDARELQLSVIRSRTGDVGLDRRYTIGPSDCASAAELLALGVDRFLSSFPEWAGPAPAPPPPPPPPSRWLDVGVVSALNSIWVPLGVDGQVGALADFGGTGHRLGGSLAIRASIPQAAGSGRFQQTALLGGAAWRRGFGSYELRVEARVGALLVSGIGYAENASDWLPWWEGAVFGGSTLRWATIGVEIAASALHHTAVTRDGLVSEDIPRIRVGLAARFGLVTRKP